MKKNCSKYVKNKNFLKILKINKLKQINFFNKANFNFLKIDFKCYKSSYPNICFKSGKFKKTLKISKLNRWNFLKASNLNSIPNLEKFVW